MKIGGLKIAGLVLACHAVTLWPSAAHAQLTAPRAVSQIELGPLSLYPSVRLTDAGKDTNVFNDVSEPKEDYTFTVTSALLAVVRLGLNELMVQSGGDYVWFREYVSERSTSAGYAVRFNFSASRFKPFVGAVHNRTRSRPNREIDARARRLERAALGGFEFNLTDRTSLAASIRLGDTSYERGEGFRGVDLAEALNRRGKLFSGGVRYAVTPLTTLAVLADYAEDVFPLSHIRDSRSYSFVPALEFSPDAAIRGRVMAGFQIFRPVNTTLPEYKGSVLSAGVDSTLYGRTTIALSASRNVNYSYQDIEPYYLLTGVRLSVGQPLFGPLDLQGGVDWEQLSYRWRQAVAMDSLGNRKDRTKMFFGGFGVNLGRGFKITVTAERAERRSNEDPRQNFKRTRLLSSVTIGS